MLGTDFAVTHAARLTDAMKAVEGGPRYGCVVFDPLLPGTDPLEALEAIDSLVPEAPMVVLADTPEGKLAKEVMKAGVQDILPKGRSIASRYGGPSYTRSSASAASLHTMLFTTRSRGCRTGRFSAIAACWRSPGWAARAPGSACCS